MVFGHVAPWDDGSHALRGPELFNAPDAEPLFNGVEDGLRVRGGELIARLSRHTEDYPGVGAPVDNGAFGAVNVQHELAVAFLPVAVFGAAFLFHA